MRVNQNWFAIKLALIALIITLSSWKVAILSYIVYTLILPYIIALIFGVKVMPSMDMGCFYGNDDKSRTNFMSATFFEYVPFD